MRFQKSLTFWILLFLPCVSISLPAESEVPVAEERKAQFIESVVEGGGLMPWQAVGRSPEEEAFRQRIEDRKTRWLESAAPVSRPVFLQPSAIQRARSNLESSDWAASWYRNQKSTADWVVSQPSSTIEAMLPELTPANPYGFTCPNCVGSRSQEAAGTSLIDWSPRDPDRFQCRNCGQPYPDPRFPETRTLEAPRSGQTFTFYENERERADPADRSGKHAWHWVGYPIHVSFSGILRERKTSYMMNAIDSLAMIYRFTGEPKYARAARDILLRLAHCYRSWLYHDYWDTFADCDPMYAAWHDKTLPIEWKRHLCADAYRKDTVEQASMLQTYWGAGRTHPSTDGVSRVKEICVAYDSIADATDEEGEPLWTPEQRSKVERDLLLEWIIGAEPFVGGENRADSHNNKAPRVYHAQAAVARCLGIAELADTALRGYEGVRDNSFLYDGFSSESPAYTNMYLSQLVEIPETLAGYEWPEGFPGREGTLNPFSDDQRLELMFRAVLDQLHPNGMYLPLSDTRHGTYPSPRILEIGQRRYPHHYSERASYLLSKRGRSEYSLFHFDAMESNQGLDLELPEIHFPAWMNAILRHGSGEEATVLSLALSPQGGHRHNDNLSLYYSDTGRTILGDLGYVGDMPVNRWIKSAKSHCLVLVDDNDQRFGGDQPRVPSLRLMATSPKVSVVEAESQVYDACDRYLRSVVLLKGPDSRTITVDRFRVSGGRKHAYRTYSELASSDSATSSLEFEGVSLPPEPPLPAVGTSLAEEDIFGLRDARVDESPSSEWTATWREGSNAYRLWMLSPCDSVVAANGLGQRSLEEAGRRVRYLDAIREGENLVSDFTAVHEPSNPDGTWTIRSVLRLKVPPDAGPEAAALHLATDWGNYLVLLDFDSETELSGLSFEGRVGVAMTRTDSEAEWVFGCGAKTLKSGKTGFVGAAPLWRSEVAFQDNESLVPTNPPPEGWVSACEGMIPYLLAYDGFYQTGFPVKLASPRLVTVGRFPPPKISEFTLPAVQLLFRDQR